MKGSVGGRGCAGGSPPWVSSLKGVTLGVPPARDSKHTPVAGGRRQLHPPPPNGLRYRQAVRQISTIGGSASMRGLLHLWLRGTCATPGTQAAIPHLGGHPPCPSGAHPPWAPPLMKGPTSQSVAS